MGLGTFNPIEVEDLSKHKMECEEAFIDQKNADIINKAIDEDRRICAVVELLR
ncbi:S-adenosylmethionine:tRNA ribosyltransferase-isomerase [Riemerella anatipestifer]|nr:S-adenosylmethionine:tRNA ribosyltransferase-isomerase [Riemerella anatipestifer]